MSATGTWLSTADSIAFVVGATADGYVDSDALDLAKLKRFRRHRLFRKVWKKFLCAALLNPPLRLRLPAEVLPHVFMPQLLSEGLIELSPAEIDQKYVRSVAKLYDRAFALYRKIESDDRFRTLISYESLTSGRNGRGRSVEVWLEELAATEDLMGMRSVDRSQELGRIFDAQVLTNMEVFVPSLREINGDHVVREPFPKGNLSPFTPRSPLFGAMGLRFFSPEELSANRPFQTFEPCHLLEFAKFDRILTEEVYDFRTSVEKHITFGMNGDPETFMLIFSYWKALFETATMVDLAQRNGGSLFYARDVPPQAPLPPPELSQAADENYLFEIFLTSRNCVPVLDSLSDILRLREDPALKPLKEILAVWNRRSKEGDVDLPRFIKKEVESAAKAAERAKGVDFFGKLLGVLALPLKLFLPGKGEIAGFAGKLMSLYAARRAASVKWLTFGTKP